MNGLLPEEKEERQQEASRLFVSEVSQKLASAHPLVRWRYSDARRMPYYFTYQARAAFAASKITMRQWSGSVSDKLGNKFGRHVEWQIASRDGQVSGRSDLVDVHSMTAIDYKAGGDPPESMIFRPEEERQLRLYAYLCLENGVTIDKGVIERGSGRRDEMMIAHDEAFDEGAAAKALLLDINALIDQGSTINDFAVPSPTGCHRCEGRVLCEPFWSAFDTHEEASKTTCVEGQVLECNSVFSTGESAFVLHLQVLRGGIPKINTITESFPAALSTADGDTLPQKGDVVRILDAKIPAGAHTLIKPCLTPPLTTVWCIHSVQ